MTLTLTLTLTYDFDFDFDFDFDLDFEFEFEFDLVDGYRMPYLPLFLRVWFLVCKSVTLVAFS